MENEYNIGDLLACGESRYRVIKKEKHGDPGWIYTLESVNHEGLIAERLTAWGDMMDDFSLMPEPKPFPAADLKSHFHFDVSLVEAAVLLGALCGEPDLLEHAKAIAKRLLLAAAQRE
jgi:hypothetical protein